MFFDINTKDVEYLENYCHNKNSRKKKYRVHCKILKLIKRLQVSKKKSHEYSFVNDLLHLLANIH